MFRKLLRAVSGRIAGENGVWRLTEGCAGRRWAVVAMKVSIGIIKEDRLGLDTIYIQAKRWQGTVGRPDIQRFTGALMGQRARKGIFITTSVFSREAREYAGNIDSKIVLIDGEQLAQLMIDHSVGVSVATIYEIKRIDSDYFFRGLRSSRSRSVNCLYLYHCRLLPT